MIIAKLLYVILPILIEGSPEQVSLPIESQAYRAGTETTQKLSIDERSIEFGSRADRSETLSIRFKTRSDDKDWNRNVDNMATITRTLSPGVELLQGEPGAEPAPAGVPHLPHQGT